ncbi:MAG TPA: divalent-cation tolerance protein CutA [Stellaceae bacterium]|nr:divalent-cation tolerance protein CutA [Stellaceae bacterium]
MSVSFVYVTAGDVEEARRIGRTVVEERLAACANIIPGVQSVYWWQGQVEESSEAALILKTTGERLDALVARVRELHSYECPGIEALAVVGGNAGFLDWVERETSGG